MLLDTDIVVDVLRQHPPAVQWLVNQAAQAVALPGFVALAVLQGCRNLADQRRAELMLNQFILRWPTQADCQRAYHDYAVFHLSHGIDLLDALIGHVAVGLNEALATFNVRHYSVIAGLQIVQPY